MSSIFVGFMHKSLQLLFWKDKKEMKQLYDVPFALPLVEVFY